MHADDAAARGIADDDAARVFNSLGEVHVRVRVTRDIRPGVLSLPKGLWRTSTLNGCTATALVADDLTDIGDGACFNDARVDVAKL
jgi:anaerobic selenocysteine-containing dehydrogenase